MSAYTGSSALLATYPTYPFAVVGGQGEYVTDHAGRDWLDFYGGHCVALTGHCHPTVAGAIAEQAHTLGFYSMAARLPIREQAADRLAAFAPASLDRVFFVNSGAEANENALRVAAMLTGRQRFVGFRGGFHGRTQLAMSVSDVPDLHARIPGLRTETALLPFGDTAALEAADLNDVAAVIVEPIQSMAGVRSASSEWFARLREKCDEAGALLIFDEIQTGMGRLGQPFAADELGVVPDMLTLAKGMASGLPMGAVLMSDAVADGLGPGDLGSTFGGSPLACAALLATLDVIREESLMARAQRAERAIRRGLAGSVVKRVRGRGLLLGLDARETAGALKLWLQAQGILVGASADPAVLRLMPPLNLSAAAVARLVSAVHAFHGETPPDTVPESETDTCSI